MEVQLRDTKTKLAVGDWRDASRMRMPLKREPLLERRAHKRAAKPDSRSQAKGDSDGCS
jgi:hypothetical protein